MSKPFALEFPLHGSRLIEASAGTGKTFTIAALYVRLVLGHGGEAGFRVPLLPTQILVVTFTEAATQELRDRIRARLAEAARYFRGEHASPDPFLRELREDYAPEEWPGCARLLETAAEWMDQAAVSTIHGWCNRMLREHAFDSGSLFTQTLETDPSELLTEVACDYWRTHVYLLDADALAALLAKWKTPQDLLAAVRPLLAAPPAIAEEQTLARLLAQVQAQRDAELVRLKQPWVAWVDELEQILSSADKDGCFNRNMLKGRDRALAALREWAQTPGQVEPALTDAAWKRFTPEGIAEAWKKGEPPQHQALAALRDLRRTLAALPDPVRAAREHAAVWICRRFEQEQRQRAQLGFSELLTRLDEALSGAGGERLAQIVRQQFPVALIDEFQDTDPVQYRIFDRIYRARDNSPDIGLFLIGDPKQAIYGFRGADIYTYLQARDATQGRHYTLDTNFRSTAAMVEAVNRVFSFAEARSPGAGAFMFRTETDNKVPFQPVQAHGRKERLLIDGSEAPALTCWEVAPGNAIGKGQYLEAAAQACASEMVRLLNLGSRGKAGLVGPDGELRGLRPADMAVLVRDGGEAESIRTALAKRGVRSVYLSDKESVFHSAEAADMLLWLKACAEPDVEGHLRAALATATLGLSWSLLERLNQEELYWEQHVLQFRGYRSIWRSQGVLPMLRRLINDFQVPARLLARPDGERALTNLLHLSELLQQADGELDGEQALVRYLAEQLLREGSGSDEQLVRLESDEDLVKVVTIHKSKGLEYPLVFLPFAATCRAVAAGRPPYRYHDDEGRLHIALDPDDEVLARADRERLAEDLRLLYVALTRACYACWVGVAAVRYGNKRDNDLHKSALGYLLSGGAPIAPAAVGSLLEQLRGGCEQIAVMPLPTPTDTMLLAPSEAAALGAARTPTRPAREHWWIASYSALALAPEAQVDDENAPTSAQELAEAPDTPVESTFSEVADEPAAEEPLYPLGDASVHRFPRGPGPGTFLHGLLEWAAVEGFAHVAANPELLQDTVARRCNRRGWTHWIEPLTRWLQHLLTTPLRLPEAEPVTLAQLASYQAELEFWFEVRSTSTEALDRRVRALTLNGAARPPLAAGLLNGMLKGFVDLVFEHQGRYYVADYKSNWLGEDDTAYSPQALRAAVLAKRYDLQYVLYILALHRLLKARLPDYDYDEHLGGAVYLFLRGIHAPGQGLHVERPPRELIEELDAMFRAAGSHQLAEAL